jgi:hypothetical protein
MAKCVRAPRTAKAKLEAMSEEEFDRWVLDKMDVCQCLDCSTHNECAKRSAERLYCIASRSPMCIEERRGCLCGDCPVKQELGLVISYHCLEGPEITRKG